MGVRFEIILCCNGDVSGLSSDVHGCAGAGADQRSQRE